MPLQSENPDTTQDSTCDLNCNCTLQTHSLPPGSSDMPQLHLQLGSQYYTLASLINVQLNSRTLQPLTANLKACMLIWDAT